jgi:predicted alpha/beta superfamily hydrolase
VIAPLLAFASLSQAALVGSGPVAAPSLSAPMVGVPALPASAMRPALAAAVPAAGLSPAEPASLPALAAAAASGPSLAARAPAAGAAAPNAGAPVPPRGGGRVVIVEDFQSAILGNTRSVAVYLPPGYDASSGRYPVLYAQDGQNLFDPKTAFGGVDWGLGETCDRLIAAGEMAPAIIVAPYNTGDRMEEYTPVRDESEHAGGRGDLYGRFLAEELKPWIDARLRTRTGAADTAIMGSSLGGLISLHLALTRPEVFGRAGVVSPSLWWADREIIARAASMSLPSPRPRLWLDIGGAEGERHVRDTRALAGVLMARGWRPGGDLAGRVYDGAGHDEGAWRARAAEILRFLFPPERR